MALMLLQSISVVYFDQRLSLVEIDFLTLNQLFPSLTEQNKQKIKGKPIFAQEESTSFWVSTSV